LSEYKERDKSKKRAAIISGAEDIFISMGYKEASMDKIAEKAGISKKTVYNHFQSKENLFEVIVYGLTKQQQHIKTCTYDSNKSLEEQLLVFAESEISLIDSAKKLELSKFLTLTFLNDPELQMKILSKYPPMHFTLVTWLNKAVDDNRIKTDNPELAARIFYALVVGAITWPVLFIGRLDKEASKPMLDEIIALFLARYGNS